MPPALIASRSVRTASPNFGSRRRNISFQKKRKIGALGNFGAPPMPPWTESTARNSPSPTRVRSSGVSARPGLGAESCARCSASAAPFCSISARRVRQACVDPLQHLPERRAAPARLRRPVGAAVHRLAVGVEEHGHRPAALLAQRMQRGHVDVVDVRPLFAIDFHIDEELVHPVRRLGVLERLVRHHVAPVAGGVADRQQDRAVAALGFRQRLRAPRAPVHGIVGVLQAGRARSRRREGWSSITVSSASSGRRACRRGRRPRRPRSSTAATMGPPTPPSA